MDKKLTLSLDEDIIEKAKQFARMNNTSLSKMIEMYFNSLTSVDESSKVKTTSLVESLTGVIELPEKFNYKSSRTNYLLEKNK